MNSVRARILRGTIVLGLVAWVGFGSGCAYTSQTAMLNPRFPIAQATRGNGVNVTVTVVDERPERDFGHRGAGISGARIRAGQDVAAVIGDSVAKGLSQLAFQPVTDRILERELKLEIRDVKYETTMGFFTGGVETSAAVKAIASNGGRRLERFYRSEDEKRVLFVPFASENERLINEAVNEVLTKLFADQQLMAFLAE